MFESMMGQRRTRPHRRARRNALLVAGCSAAILASPAVGASAQAAGIDAICTGQATIGFTPALNNNTVAASATGTFSNCLLSGGLTSATISTPTPLTASGCFPLFSITGNTGQLAWNNGTTSTFSVAINTNPLTGAVSLSATVIAGTFAGDTITPIPVLAANGGCGLGPTTALQAPLALVVLSS